MEDPVNPNSFKLAAQYATLFPESMNIELNAKNSQASARVAEFNHAVIKFQQKHQAAFGDAKQTKAMQDLVKKEQTSIQIAERFLKLKPSAAASGLKKG